MTHTASREQINVRYDVYMLNTANIRDGKTNRFYRNPFSKPMESNFRRVRFLWAVCKASANSACLLQCDFRFDLFFSFSFASYF